ncbi:MAG: hypothetical protein ACOYJ6_18470 [Caulobacterales bacterium]
MIKLQLSCVITQVRRRRITQHLACRVRPAASSRKAPLQAHSNARMINMTQCRYLESLIRRALFGNGLKSQFLPAMTNGGRAIPEADICTTRFLGSTKRTSHYIDFRQAQDLAAGSSLMRHDFTERRVPNNGSLTLPCCSQVGQTA